MISHEHKCVFIHIPKTAGSSIEKKLGFFNNLKYGIQDHRPIRKIRPRTFWRFSRLMLRPVSYISRKDFLKSPLNNPFYPDSDLTSKQFESYFKFTFVRNPWARMYSWYKHVMRVKQHQEDMKLPANCSFKKFMLDFKDVNYGFRSQLWWIQDFDGSIPLDFIGKFENLENDFAEIASSIGIKDLKLPTLLASNNRPYTDAYDDELVDFVRTNFYEEIALFNYEFGN